MCARRHLSWLDMQTVMHIPAQPKNWKCSYGRGAAAGISFLGLPAVPLPYKDSTATAPAESGALAPAPSQASGQSTVKSFVSSFINVWNLPIMHCKPILLSHALTSSPLYHYCWINSSQGCNCAAAVCEHHSFLSHAICASSDTGVDVS